MSQIDTIHKSEFPRCHIHRHYLDGTSRSSNGTCSGTHAFIIEENFIRTESGIFKQRMSCHGVPRSLMILELYANRTWKHKISNSETLLLT